MLIALWALTLTWAGPGMAQAPSPATAPDILVLVYQRPGLGDQVDITYSHVVPPAQAQHDVQALAQAAGWTVEQSKITNGLPPVQGRGGAMTSASFIVAHAIDDTSHTFPLEALITAFRSYKRLALVFFVASGFQFQGLGQYTDKNVQVAMEQHGSAYTYQIQVLNSSFDRLNLPQPNPAQEAGRGRRSPLLLLLGILVAAGAVGVLVYAVTSRLAAPEKPADEKTFSEPKDKTNAGNP